MSLKAIFPLLGLLIGGLLLSPLAMISASEGAESEQTGKVDRTEAAAKDVGQGALRIIGEDGSIVECPLKHTDVKADVAGFIARVNVTQTFHNSTEETIEAIYVFPLPNEAAVDDMTMVIGERKIVGVIKRRDEARQIYEQAVMQGQTAALLEQERPNIFTQSVGNIAPGQEVKIQISYVDVLKYDVGEYEFHFPMVVGPRFIPGAAIDLPDATPPAQQGKVSPPVANTDRVPDAKRISPPVLRPEFRNGHEISLQLTLDAGVPVQDLAVINHKINVERQDDRGATIQLSPGDSIPNKDFVVRYRVVGQKPEMAVLAHTGKYSADAVALGNGYFMLMIQPQENQQLKKNPPREIVFLIDVSGSMRGEKTEKAKQAMQSMLGLCRPQDTVQVVTFASNANKLFEKPLPVDQTSIQRALNFTSGLQGSGGTRMLQGVQMAIDEPIDDQRLRVIVMLTDGFIGNEAEIIQHVGTSCGDQIRFWAVGVGQSPNMFLIDGVARQGGGMGKRLGLNDEAESLAHDVITRIQRAQLAKVKIDWGDLQVAETYPTQIPELWAGRPIIVFGRYREGGRHEIQVSGSMEGDPVQWPLTVDLPKEQAEHDVLAKVWARRQIEDLMHQSYYAGSPAVEETVTAIALNYRLMSPYTSFVAVDQKDADNLTPPARPPRQLTVPVPLPEGAQWEGFFGDSQGSIDEFAIGESVQLGRSLANTRNTEPQLRLARGFGGAIGGARGGGGRANVVYSRSAAGASPANYRSLERMYFESPARPQSLAEAQSSLSRLPASSRMSLEALVPVRRNRGRGLAVADGRLLGGIEQLTEARWAYAAIRPQASALQQAAQAALQQMEAESPKLDRQETRNALLRAAFLDRAAANAGGSNGQIAMDALARLEELHQQLIDEWTKQLPVLDQRLDLVLRNTPLPQAVEQIENAAGVSIELVAGSIDDVAHLAEDPGRVGYLDLRGATLAQALEWILRPARLNWRLDGNSIVAGSQRRLAGRSAWVYDVAQIALPTDDELGQDREKAGEETQKLMDQFLTVVRSEVQAGQGDEIAWFAPGQLLVFGDTERHARVGQLLDGLESSAVQLEGEAGQLQRITSVRAKSHQEPIDKWRVAQQANRIAELHDKYGWQLLAAAAHGQLDDEALTWLTIAWSDPITKNLLDGESRALPLRTLWLITEASKALPGETKLAVLAQTARELSAGTIQTVLTDLQQSPQEAFAALAYGVLALRDDSAMRQQALKYFGETGFTDEQLQKASLLVRTLLVEREQIDTAALSKLVGEDLAGQDLVVLCGLACRRAGGSSWQAFRAQSQDLVGGQPLPGHVVKLLHHLPENRLPITNEG